MKALFGGLFRFWTSDQSIKLYLVSKLENMFTDKLSQRILASLIGVSTVIIASAGLIFTLNSSFTATAADTPADEEVWDDGLRGAVALGIKDSTGYFVVWGNPNLFYKVELDRAKDWYETDE